MTVAISGAYQGALTITETYSGGDLSSSSNPLTFGAYNLATTVTGTLRAGGQAALVSGALTLDLTNLATYGTNGATINATGLQLKAWIFQNPSGNANPITAKFGAATAYLLWGAAWSIILSPGMHVLGFANAATPVISGTLKNIDLAGTGAQPLNFEFLFG